MDRPSSYLPSLNLLPSNRRRRRAERDQEEEGLSNSNNELSVILSPAQEQQQAEGGQAVIMLASPAAESPSSSAQQAASLSSLSPAETVEEVSSSTGTVSHPRQEGPQETENILSIQQEEEQAEPPFLASHQLLPAPSSSRSVVSCNPTTISGSAVPGGVTEEVDNEENEVLASLLFSMHPASYLGGFLLPPDLPGVAHSPTTPAEGEQQEDVSFLVNVINAVLSEQEQESSTAASATVTAAADHQDLRHQQVRRIIQASLMATRNEDEDHDEDFKHAEDEAEDSGDRQD